ncbi:MAG: precorrin-3B C(17)-methyltransferase [Clostridia bacterium]|nr:precorrin-3B C(17)-methyltransferase [Clostridia bacterium]
MGKVYAVGIGPGDPLQMTAAAAQVLAGGDVIAGYSGYVDLIRPLYPDRKFIETPMRGEVERCQLALEAARAGQTVAVICSGDAGIYGMAGLLIEMAGDTEITVMPGVTAAISGAALLGAPLGHDFAVISLSDLLTPWEKIEKRLELAAEADLCMALYNPGSRKRADYLQRACRIIRRHAAPETVCGIARNVGRDGECISILSLQELETEPADMFTTVFIGNSQTKRIGNRMVTPRGYHVSDE